METQARHRRVHLGRRVEALPGWLFVLLLATVLSLVLASVLLSREHTTPGGTNCGGVIVANPLEDPRPSLPGCREPLSPSPSARERSLRSSSSPAS